MRALVGREARAFGDVAAFVAAAFAHEGGHALGAEAVDLVDGAHHDAAAGGPRLGVGGVKEACDLHHAVEDLAVVDADRDVVGGDAGGLKRRTQHGADLGVGGDGGRPHRVGVALGELAEAPRSGLLVAPDRAHGIAAVRVGQVAAVLGEDAGERGGEVVAECEPALVGVFPGEYAGIGAVDIGKILAQGLDGLDGAAFERVEAVGGVDRADPGQHGVAGLDLGAEAVAKAPRGFCAWAAGFARCLLGHVGSSG